MEAYERVQNVLKAKKINPYSAIETDVALTTAYKTGCKDALKWAKGLLHCRSKTLVGIEKEINDKIKEL